MRGRRKPAQPTRDERTAFRHGGMSGHEHISAGTSEVRPRSDAEIKLDAALNGMQQGLCMFDAEGRIVMFNQRYIDLMKLPASDLLGMSLLELFRRRNAAGRNIGDPDQMFAELIDSARAGRVLVHKVQSLDGKAQSEEHTSTPVT